MGKEKNDIVVFQAKNGAIELKGDFIKETVWANQAQIAEIFGVDRTVVTKHVSNIFKDNELKKSVVCAKFAHTTKHGAIEGKTQIKLTVFYNLDIILAVGYRVKSSVATKFRQWTTKTLKSHIVDGYSINPSRISKNYEKFLKAVEDVKNLLPQGSV
ncbi:MAG: RhuM family protein [Candidatus Gracilibacteria bacterium]|nr:RhuM family protein [Candidatus Gracilibacteria bacterium]